MTVRYIGMNRDTGQTLTDSEHISQSVRDILITCRLPSDAAGIWLAVICPD